MKLSDCPYAPNDPRWHDWQMQYIVSHGPGGPLNQLNAQLKRMDTVKRSVQAQRTNKNDWHDEIMAEVEAHERWVEQGQPKPLTVSSGLRDLVRGLQDFRFTPLDPTGNLLSGRLSQQDPSLQRIPNPGTSLRAIPYFPQIPTDEPVDPALQLMADLLHTTPDQIKASVDVFANLFVDIGKTIAKVFTDVWELLKAAIKAKKNKTDHGYIRNIYGLWIWWPNFWVWDMRPSIATFTWLQYDAI